MKQNTNYSLKRIRGFAIVVLFLTAAVWSVGAQGLPEQADAFLEFADQVIDEEMDRHGVPNVTLSVVRGDTIYALRGYGFTNLETGQPVDPETTIFRVASVSKSVVATAVMTLADRGLISLDEDVNRWISAFKVPEVNGSIVTWHDLLTHSAGIDDKVYFPTSTEDPASYISLEEAFRCSPPVRFAESAQSTRYSNQGYALLGYLVEQVSGMPFEAYVRQYVFTPLDMGHSTFEQVLPDGLSGQAVKSYLADEDSGWVEQPVIYVNEMPAGGLYTTSADMARFMLMHLNGGYFAGRQVLSEGLVGQMHESRFSAHPELKGYGYGFWHSAHNGAPLIMHDGNGPAIASRMLLLPGEQTGIFLAQQGGNSKFLLAVTDRILEQYLGEAPAPEPVASESVARYEGLYKNNRYVHSGYFLLPTNIGLELSIRAEGGRLLTSDPLEQVERAYVETSPGVFTRTDRPENKLAFLTDAQGRVTRMHAELYRVPMDFEAAGWWERNSFLMVVLLVPTVVYFLTVLILPLAALIGKLRKREKTKAQRRILQFSWLFSLFALVVMMLFVLGDLSPLPYWSPVTSPAAVYGFLGFAFLTSVLALGVPVSWYFAIRRHTWQWRGHIAHTLFLLGTLLFLWFSVYNGLFFFPV
ncbi:serine hydrolase domain-containing protein [Phaeodactylibacter xiamenensis]|uniref:serine hydrolase domain-containing protein n=1 Tax=Phaeodactylibacter xiamenensis TaxID=1524460 RepID=UPI0024A98C2C|nr:serine hydrolase domain-containing protein [Phaeodactylibacter xiamenensis]